MYPKYMIVNILSLKNIVRNVILNSITILQKITKMTRIDEKRYLELIKEKEKLEESRPSDVNAMRQWKHSMSKILQELELFH